MIIGQSEQEYIKRFIVIRLRKLMGMKVLQQQDSV